MMKINFFQVPFLTVLCEATELNCTLSLVINMIDLYPCALCHNQYRDGPHVHEGVVLKSYGGIVVCQSCWEYNYDGWAPHRAKKLIELMEQKGLPLPQRNSEGFLPRA